MNQDGFINFIENNYFLKNEESDNQILSPRRMPQNDSPHNNGPNFLTQIFKAKITSVVMNEKKLTNEIFQRFS